MAQKWNYKYGNNDIVVTNFFDGCELSINGKTHDKKKGLTLSDELTGKLPAGEEVKVFLNAGVLKVKCMLLINNMLQEPISEN